MRTVAQLLQRLVKLDTGNEPRKNNEFDREPGQVGTLRAKSLMYNMHFHTDTRSSKLVAFHSPRTSSQESYKFPINHPRPKPAERGGQVVKNLPKY